MDMIIPFHSIWNKVEAFKIEEPQDDEQAYWCGYAREFYTWLNETVFSETEPNLVSVNQAKIILLDKYLEWRSFVPKTHQERINGKGHICIYHVFIRTCERLKVIELRISKPMLFIPSPPQIPPRIEPKGPILFLDPLEE